MSRESEAILQFFVSQLHLYEQVGSWRDIVNKHFQHHVVWMHFQRTYLLVELLFLVFRDKQEAGKELVLSQTTITFTLENTRQLQNNILYVPSSPA